MRAPKTYAAHLVVLVMLAMNEACFGIEVGERYNVYIINNLNHNVLKIHCKSKDDDLGEHVLRIKGQFHFTFKANFWGTTLFWCNLKWGKKHGGGYRIFWYRDDLLSMCGYKEKRCTWSARNSGILLRDVRDGGEFKHMYDWQS
ncbi:S-protein homolog 21-like [Mercurialis annua]|uniref:S-protein homolog 21-like n=1 Tax=Mercurialis annua TaxID=3986 RepID=UPI00215E2BD1|nr:S-protein homolog 21-like [Mercurialis annua]